MSEQPDRYGSGPLHTFSIGIAGSPDLAAAQKVADLIGTVHHGFTFTVQDGLDAIFDVIWHIESYEQIRASVPMYLLSRKIKAMGYKVRSRRRLLPTATTAGRSSTVDCTHPQPLHALYAQPLHVPCGSCSPR